MTEVVQAQASTGRRTSEVFHKNTSACQCQRCEGLGRPELHQERPRGPCQIMGCREDVPGEASA